MAKRIVLLLVSGLTFIIICLAVLLGALQFLTLRQSLVAQGQSTACMGAEIYASVLEHGIRTAIFSKDEVLHSCINPGEHQYSVPFAKYLSSNLEDTFAGMLNQEVIYYAYGVECNGYVPLHSDPALTGQFVEEKPNPDQSQDMIIRTDARGYRFMQFSCPIEVMETFWGEFRVGIPVAWLYRQSFFRTLAFFVPAIFLCGILIWVVYVMARRSMKPLKELVKVTNAMAGGDFNVRAADYKKRDEVGVLARSFNGMACALDLSQTLLERKVEERTQMLDKVIEHAPSAIVIVDMTTQKIVRANRAAGLLTETDSLNLVGQKLSDAVKEEETEEPKKEAEEEGTEVRIRGRKGTVSTVIKYSAMVELNGRGHMLVTLTDVSVIKKMQDELINQEQRIRHAQKMEAIGQLAAGIAHEINTPSQFVGDNLRFLQDAFADLKKSISRFEETVTAKDSEEGTVVREIREECDLEYLDSEVPQAIEQSLDGIRRIAGIVQAMKEFSHPGSGEMQAVDLNRTITNAVEVARNEWKYHAEMTLQLDDNLPMVCCRSDEINQVLLNLVVNAAHAVKEALQMGVVEEKGSIIIDTRQMDEQVEVSIRDTGTGISQENRNRIFDPFFTTKEVGKGTGQGLAIAYDVIVRKHGGILDFETTPGEGTTFFIRLPIDGMKKDSEKQRDE